MRRRRHERAWVMIVGLLGLIACGHGAPPPAEATLDAIRRAMMEGDAEALYALSTSETKAVHGPDGVAELVAAGRDELRQTARALETAQGQLEVTLRFPDGDPVAMVIEDGSYRLHGAILGGASLGSPEEAVLALRAALERRSLQGVLRVLTTERRRAILAEMDALSESARDPLDFDMKITGDKAVVRLPGRTVIFLERESDEWRIVDVSEDARR
jgi:hypothetical protein